MRRRAFDHAADHPWFVIRHARQMPVGRRGVSQDSAGPPLRNAQPRADRVHGLASPGRAQTFPEATSLRIALSRAWSATSFFSRRFSCSSAFNGHRRGRTRAILAYPSAKAMTAERTDRCTAALAPAWRFRLPQCGPRRQRGRGSCQGESASGRQRRGQADRLPDPGVGRGERPHLSRAGRVRQKRCFRVMVTAW